MTLLQFINSGSAAFAFLAAAGWFWSAVVRVRPEPDKDGWGDFVITDTDKHGRETDVLASIQRASRISAWSATAAGIAAGLQGLVILLAPAV